MDASQQATVTSRDREGSVAAQRQRRSIAEKRRIVEETLVPGASVAKVARAHGVNAIRCLAGAASRAKPCSLGRSVRAHSHERRGEPLLRRPRLHGLISLPPRMLAGWPVGMS